jgi:6-methylsalicylate decarboxylase
MSNNDLIDVHAHFLTNRYLNAALGAGITHPDGMLIWPHWSLDEHLDLMAQNRIQRAILSISSPGVHFGDDDGATALARDVNDFAAEISREYPQRFGFFASLPLPAVDAAVDEAARAIDKLGALGVIVMSNSDGQYLGDPALNPLWAVLNQRQATPFVHPTSPPHAHAVALDRPRPMVEFMFETTRTVTDMIFAAVTERYPDIHFLIPHCGATLPLVADRVELFRKLLPGPHGRPPARLSTRHQLQRFCPSAYGVRRWRCTTGFARKPGLVIGQGAVVIDSDGKFEAKWFDSIADDPVKNQARVRVETRAGVSVVQPAAVVKICTAA